MGKEYNMDLHKQYEVEFIKDVNFFKKGDKTSVNMPLASKFFKDGKIRVPNNLMQDAKSSAVKNCSLNRVIIN
ncbi:hypothetical protein ACIXR2_17470 [Bacteroides fragilis]